MQQSLSPTGCVCVCVYTFVHVHSAHRCECIYMCGHMHARVCGCRGEGGGWGDSLVDKAFMELQKAKPI